MYACVGINVLVSPFQFFFFFFLNTGEGGKVWHTVSQNLSVSNRLFGTGST